MPDDNDQAAQEPEPPASAPESDDDPGPIRVSEEERAPAPPPRENPRVAAKAHHADRPLSLVATCLRELKRPFGCKEGSPAAGCLCSP
jgi:hypothetical protein